MKEKGRTGEVKATATQDSQRGRLIINTEHLPSPKSLKIYN